MKMRNLLLFLMVGVFALASCSKDEEEQLIGDWEGVSASLKVTYEGETVVDDNVTFTNANRPTITLTADNTYISTSQDEDIWDSGSGTYVVNGNKITMDDEVTFDFTVSGSQLVLTSKGEEDGGTYDARFTFRRK